MLTFAAVYLWVWLIPGAALTVILGCKRHRFLLSVSLSYVVLVVVLTAARLLNLGITAFGYVQLFLYGILVLIAGVKLIRTRSCRFESQYLRWEYVPPTLVAVIAGLYSLVVGPYSEIPADAWFHIGRIGDNLDHVASGLNLGHGSGLEDLAGKEAALWYTAAACIVYFAGLGLEDALMPLNTANTILFASAVYAFALCVFRHIELSRGERHCAAVVAVFFFFVHFGINVFSYVRYYTFAPTFLNYVLYMTAVACLLRYITVRNGEYKYLGIVLVTALVAGLVHLQEALFIAIMAGAILVAAVGMKAAAYGEMGGIEAIRKLFRADKRILVPCAIVVVGYVALHAGAYVFVQRHNPYTHDVMASIQNYVPFLRNLFVLKPTFQFYEVITVWGVLVYVLFIVNFGKFRNSAFFIAGMLVPFITVFNPLFTDFFLRFSWPQMLWRMCYLIPLEFAAACLFVVYVRRLKDGGGTAKLLRSGVLAAALLGLLFPVNTTFFVAPYSKTYTLRAVERQNDYVLWGDLLDFLNTVESNGVITDPVTGYVVEGLTDHDFGGYKFYGYSSLETDRKKYGDREFGGKDDWIVVINERDGGESDVGRISKHWPKDVLKVSRNYSREFKEYVAGSGLFTEIWSRDRIKVYRIRS